MSPVNNDEIVAVIDPERDNKLMELYNELGAVRDKIENYLQFDLWEPPSVIEFRDEIYSSMERHKRELTESQERIDEGRPRSRDDFTVRDSKIALEALEKTLPDVEKIVAEIDTIEEEIFEIAKADAASVLVDLGRAIDIARYKLSRQARERGRKIQEQKRYAVYNLVLNRHLRRVRGRPMTSMLLLANTVNMEVFGADLDESVRTEARRIAKQEMRALAMNKKADSLERKYKKAAKAMRDFEKEKKTWRYGIEEDETPMPAGIAATCERMARACGAADVTYRKVDEEAQKLTHVTRDQRYEFVSKNPGVSVYLDMQRQDLILKQFKTSSRSSRKVLKSEDEIVDMLMEHPDYYPDEISTREEFLKSQDCPGNWVYNHGHTIAFAPKSTGGAFADRAKISLQHLRDECLTVSLDHRRLAHLVRELYKNREFFIGSYDGDSPCQVQFGHNSISGGLLHEVMKMKVNIKRVHYTPGASHPLILETEHGDFVIAPTTVDDVYVADKWK